MCNKTPPRGYDGFLKLRLLALRFFRFMRAMVRHVLADQPALEIPHRKGQQLVRRGDFGHLTCSMDLRKEDETETSHFDANVQ